ncbi:TonB-dependent receptor [Prolixibacteraceae bacterium JC049]|nr:TonB-dependent receptor [Prolixibacteraceae bacterium JC049]
MKKTIKTHNLYGLCKFLRIMRISVFLFLFAVVQGIAGNALGQQAKLNLKLRNTSIIDVLQQIEDQTDIHFFYQSDDLAGKKLKDVSVQNKTVNEILDAYLPKLRLKYESFDKYIAITKSNKSQADGSQKVLTVKGAVTDSAGEPLPGVSILIKGTTQGITTNFDGKYELAKVPNGATLVFSFIGMKKKEIVVDGQQVVDVTMEEDAVGLEEVVAVGYGVVKKSDLTGAVVSVSSEKLSENPVTRVDQALQGRTAGVEIKRTDGSPGGNVKIRIRGANSLKGNNNPLVVVDGFLGGNLKDINPSEIQSIEILKDASATAVYGSRGANGVILVTTKRGKKGAPKVSVNSYMSFQSIRHEPSRLTPYEYGEFVNRREQAYGRQPMFSQAQLNEFNTTGVNYPDQIMRTAVLQNHQIGIQGGSETFRYLVSGNMIDHKGIVVNNKYKKYSLRSNLDLDITSKLNAQLNLFAVSDVNHSALFNGYWGKPIYQAYAFAPIIPVRDEKGNYVNENPNYGPLGQANPVALAREPIIDNYATTITANGRLSYEISKGLTLSISGGLEKRNSNGNSYFNENTRHGMEVDGVASISNNYSVLWQNTNQLSYVKTFDEKHNLSATAVFEQQHFESRNNGVSRNRFITNTLGYYNLSLAKGYPGVSSGFSEWDIHSFLGRVNYSFASKYFITASMRADGSSKFGKGNRWAYFPSGSLAWRVSEEKWIKSLNIFSNFKIRTSYGVTGSQAAPAYSSLATLRTGWNYPFDGINPVSGVGPAGIGNPDLKWETTAQYNVGADMNWFDNKLGLTFDIYKKKTTNLLLDKKLPDYTGSSSFTTNIGEFENKGFEIGINAMPLSGDLKWETGFNISHNVTTAVDLGEDEYLDFGSFRLYSGGKTGQVYGLEFLGTWKKSEAAEAAKFGHKPGDAKFKDQNNDGVVDLKNDRVIIANTQPDFIFGFTNQFSYGNFELSVLINGVVGGDIYNSMRGGMNSLEYIPTHADARNMWTPENETNYPTFSLTNKHTWETSSRWVEDGTFVRLKNVTLGYQLPKRLFNNSILSSARIYFSGENLVTFTNYSGFDPEISSTGNSDVEMGVDNGSYPTSRIFTFGIDIKF